MEWDESRDVLADGQSHSRSKDIVPLRSVAVKRVGEYQIFKRRPLVRNKDGTVIWQADRAKFCYRDETSGKHYSCYCSIDGGVVVIRDHLGDVVEAYKLRDGETVETVIG